MGVTLIYNEISSDELGIYVENRTKTYFPERKLEKIDIPGGRTLIYEDFNNYQDYDYAYTMWWRHDVDGNEKILKWLNNPGYNKLEDSTYPFFVRYAYIAGGIEIDNRNNVVDRADIVFSCKPYWYYKTGEKIITTGEGTTASSTGSKILSNPGETAYPIIEVTPFNTSVTSEISLNGSTIHYQGTKCIIDSSRRYIDGTGYTMTGGFPELIPGENTLYWEYTKSVKIIPRWCRLLP